MPDFIYPRDFFDHATHDIDESLCFVLMPFDDEHRVVYQEAIKPAVEGAGMTCRRADDIYSSRTIMIEVMEQIDRAGLIVADLSGRNPNVFYELALAHMVKTNERVFLLSSESGDIPFDLRHFRILGYTLSAEGIENLRRDLSRVLTDRAGPRRTVLEGSLGDLVVQVVSESGRRGSLVRVRIRGNFASPGVGAYAINIAFDESKVTPVDGDSYFGVLNPFFAKGTLKLNGSELQGLVGPVDLGTVDFRLGQELGIAVLRLVQVQLWDPWGRDVAQNLKTIDGAITITSF